MVVPAVSNIDEPGCKIPVNLPLADQHRIKTLLVL